MNAADKRTSYQRSHHPIKVVEHKCCNTVTDEDGLCTSCGRYLSRKAAHLPNNTGELGWTEYYADGTVFNATTANRK